ncbi:hypothetical protein Hanom_Chr04g00335051 [Helianthus anomalus]
MDSELYNAFATSGSSSSIVQNMNLDNEIGTSNKPPKLTDGRLSKMATRFENYVQTTCLEAWIGTRMSI